MKTSKKNIAFFFGAGAESKAFDLPTGEIFLSKSIAGVTRRNGSELLQTHLLKDTSFFGEPSYKLSQHTFNRKDTYKSIYAKTLLSIATHESDTSDRERDTFFKKYSQLFLETLNGDDLKEVLGIFYPGDKSSSKRKEYETRPKTTRSNVPSDNYELFKAVFLGNSAYPKNYKKLLFSDFIQYKERGNDSFLPYINSNLSFLLDANFHAIISPMTHGPIRFSRICNYYWGIFFIIYQSVIDCLKNEAKSGVFSDLDSHNILNLPNEPDSLEILQSSINTLYSIDFQNSNLFKNSYYAQLKNKLPHSVNVTGILTTNYYRFPEILNSNIAYLNGSLNLFEYPGYLEVLDITKYKSLPYPGALCFPFILGQSYVKPIITQQQIEQFSKMSQILNDSEILVVLGYNINSDDNHINSYLHDFVYKDKKQIIVINSINDFSSEASAKNSILRKLRLDKTDENLNKILICSLDYNDLIEDSIDTIITTII